MMRGITSVMVVAALLLALTASVGLAVDFNEVSCPTVPNTNNCYGTPGPDKMIGTASNDEIFGMGGGDQISGGSDEDEMRGGRGNDTINDTNLLSDGDTDKAYGNRGNDTIDVKEGEFGIDYVYCGAGTDTVFYDDQFNENANDRVFDCEIKNPQP
jgi:hypothetical protein